MRVEVFDKFVQINIKNSNPMLQKILKYATKHFQKQYHLSTSILILDDGERFKKNYLINWAYHIAEQSQNKSYVENNNELEYILSFSYLPIRIKTSSDYSLLECIKISFRMIGIDRAMLTLDRPNHIAKRYISAHLSPIIVSSDLNNISLDATKKDFWVYITNIIGNKIIHNVRLEFDYDSFKPNRFGRKSFSNSYMTKQEQKLQRAYQTLNCNIDDDFFTVKNSYLELIKQYHPDKVFNKDKATIELYNLKFIEIKEAFDIIKSHLEKIV